MADPYRPWLRGRVWAWVLRLLLAALVCRDALASPVLGPRGDLQPSEAAPRRRLHGRFLHITDLHPDEFYKAHSSTDEDAVCHRGSGPAGTYGAETSDCDSPFSLINATFDWLAANVADNIDFVIWTGDSARHDSDERIPRSAPQVLGTNRWIAGKFSEVFGGGGAERRPAVPVVPTLGNNDILPHNILRPGPNKWLQYYADIWRGFIPEEQRHSFEFGGWFYVEVVPNKLAVFSLNTLYFFDRNAGVDDCEQPSEPGFKQMEWLRIQLQFMRQRGMKAILMGHVPPARTQSKQLWHESCWQKYTLWLKQYRDVVVSGLYGHMNIDHFLLQDTHDVDILSSGARAGEGRGPVRKALEDELSIESTADYLRELREKWAELPRPAALDGGAEGSGKKGRGKRRKKKLGRWAHRYQLSLVAPSIVPNYFPALRIVEYNISGLEDAVTWADMTVALPVGEAQRPLKLRDIPNVEAEAQNKKRKKGGRKPGRPEDGDKKGKSPKDPNLTIPDPPAKSSPPGPAYSPQPLTLTGYVQYYANLTQINTATPSKPKVGGDRWRPGKHHGKTPEGKPASHHEFQFEVEYSTFDDDMYNVTDLTVKSFVKLAYLMGQEGAKSDSLLPAHEDSEEYDETGAGDIVELEDIDGQDRQRPNESDEKLYLAKKKHGKGGGKKGKKNKSTSNRVWLYFLRHAFVSSVEENDLKKMVH